MKAYTITMKVFNIQWEENDFRWKSPNEIKVSIKLYPSQFPKDQYDMKDLINDYLIDFCGDCDCVYEFGKDFDIEEEEEEAEEEAEEIHVIDFTGFQTINEYQSKYKNNASIFPIGSSETILPLMQNNKKKWLPKYLKQICEFTEEEDFAFDFEKRDFKKDWNSFRMETNEMQFVILQLKNVSYENINNESTSYLWSEKGYLLIINKINDRYSFESHYLPSKGIYAYERYEKSSRPRTINQMLRKFGKIYTIDFWMKEII